MDPQTSSVSQFGKRIVKALVIFPIRVYQAAISPWFPASCRHVPTCSQYTIEAIQEWGIFRGTWMGMRRISKCHPWGTSGYDPVPKKGDKAGPDQAPG